MIDRVIRQAIESWRALELHTRPVHPESRRALDARWADLPASARTDAQTLGRAAVGCEGTHGVFPKCDLTCTPCYHSSDANKVRVDGAHTIREVRAQMAFFRARRGPRGHAQLIGGEVSLLAPDDHAAALLAMHEHGREPMSMTHGDFDPKYLRALALGPNGRPRFERLSFAGHFDSLMHGRQGAPRPRSEAELNPYRQRFVDMFIDLRKQHGIRSYLAHNMTVTPANLGQVEGVIKDVLPMGFSMMSFQPAAFVGDNRRWNENYADVTIDAVWDAIETGTGQPISWRALQFGDNRCNRVGVGFLVGTRWVPYLDADSAIDLAARDRFFAHLAGVTFSGGSRPVLAAKIGRVIVRHPGDVLVATRWLRAVLRRSGGLRAVFAAVRTRRLRPMNFVVHNFMDAAEVAPAWELMQAGITSADPATRATQERLSACNYTMAHPETDQLVPACAQHSVFDPDENAALRILLPLSVVTRPTKGRDEEPASRPGP